MLISDNRQKEKERENEKGAEKTQIV